MTVKDNFIEKLEVWHMVDSGRISALIDDTCLSRGGDLYRKETIIALCKNKYVLHLGFIQHHDLYEKKIAEGDWLHSKIAQVAERLVGVDYLKEDVEIIKEKYNYEAFYADVTDFESMKKIKAKFKEAPQVIVCGELIEHVDNPKGMLENIKQFMGKDTILIITTPNPFHYHRMRLMISGSYECEWLNKEHVAWYSYQTLKQLLERNGFKEIYYGYYQGENFDTNKSSWKELIKKTFIAKELSDGLFFVASRNDAEDNVKFKEIFSNIET